jgi:ribosomal protein S9
MRDIVAGLAATFFVLVALGLATSLQSYRRRRDRLRHGVREQGQSILAEIPTDDGLALFTEDPDAFYWNGQMILKNQIRTARISINGAPISVSVSRRFPMKSGEQPTSFAGRFDGITRDRWDVSIDTSAGTVLVECGAIREQVSQDLARRVFEAVKSEIKSRDQ